MVVGLSAQEAAPVVCVSTQCGGIDSRVCAALPLPSLSPSSQLTNTIMDIVQQASNYKQLRKGANEGEASWDKRETQREGGAVHRIRSHTATTPVPLHAQPPRR